MPKTKTSQRKKTPRVLPDKLKVLKDRTTEMLRALSRDTVQTARS